MLDIDVQTILKNDKNNFSYSKITSKYVFWTLSKFLLNKKKKKNVRE